MENLRVRIFITVLLVLLGVIWVTPNFMDTKNRWWFTQDKIVKGLDIQGGLHLVLKVDIESVMKEKTSRLARSLAEEFNNDHIKFASAKINPQENKEIEITVDSVTDIEPVVNYLEDKYGSVLQVLDSQGNLIRARYLDPVVVNYRDQIIAQAIEVIRNRIDEFGVAEPSISSQGNDRILVQLPGIKDEKAAEAKELIHKTARLDFRIVNDEVDPSAVAGWIQEAETKGGYKLGNEGLKYSSYVRKLNEDLKDKIPQGFKIVFEKDPNAKTLEAGKVPFLVASETELTGDLLEDAHVSRGQYGEPVVIFSFNVEGRRAFAKLTGENVNKRMAIVLDEVIKSAPVVKGRIDTPTAQITLGSSNYKEALSEGQLIATALRAGALPASLEQLEERTVGPTLGADSIHAGEVAGVVAAVLVLIFMLVYYKGLGVIANIALILNILFLLAILTSLGATLTLPGVAGIVLTLGMAVDANVIIFERMKEELARGAGIKAVIKDGFGQAFSAILDANITTAAVCIVLMYFGTGPVRGFAITLICGIVTSMFTAIFVSRTIIEWYVNKFKVEKLSI
ncbi:MAG: protein translocase subunit SecD [Bdellovibrionales bacterium]|nr:protein translocase subunit SecD [Bdellovibrionales bacterium]